MARRPPTTPPGSPAPSQGPPRPPSPSRPPAEELPPGATSLDEVERALSLLDGRHQDAVRVQRETQRAIEAKRAEVEEAAAKAERRSRAWKVTWVVGGALLLAGVGVGGWFGLGRYRSAKAADAALAAVEAPYLALGFQPAPRSTWQARDRMEATIPADTCVVVLATRPPGGGEVTVDRPSGALRAPQSLAYCTCHDEHVIVHSQGGGAALLSTEARVVGGNGALGFLTPRPASLPVSDVCPHDPLDGWLAGGHVTSTPSAEGLATSVREALEARGFKLTASAPGSLPFALVPGSADTCFVATSTTSGEALSLRVLGGERPLKEAPGVALGVGWCTHMADAATVWREGTGSVVVYRIASADIGGTLGLRETTSRAGLGDLPAWVRPAERGWDASAALVAVGVAPRDVTLPREPRPVPNARLVSLTLVGAHATPDPDERYRYVCSPALTTSPGDALCVQSSSLAWRAPQGELPGIAEAPLPFWMDILTQVEDAGGMAIELQLLALGKSLLAQHYEATRSGVVEEKDGVTITGREGDDRVVAVGLLATTPWVLPYSDDAPWTLDTPPHPITLGAGIDVHLRLNADAPIPPDVRRTVVFRHRATH